jgi:hypothetical protein
VVDKHDLVRQLVDNGWLYLFRIDPQTGLVEGRRGGMWNPAAPRKAHQELRDFGDGSVKSRPSR